MQVYRLSAYTIMANVALADTIMMFVVGVGCGLGIVFESELGGGRVAFPDNGSHQNLSSSAAFSQPPRLMELSRSPTGRFVDAEKLSTKVGPVQIVLNFDAPAQKSQLQYRSSPFHSAASNGQRAWIEDPMSKKIYEEERYINYINFCSSIMN